MARLREARSSRSDRGAARLSHGGHSERGVLPGTRPQDAHPPAVSPDAAFTFVVEVAAGLPTRPLFRLQTERRGEGAEGVLPPSFSTVPRSCQPAPRPHPATRHGRACLRGPGQRACSQRSVGDAPGEDGGQMQGGCDVCIPCSGPWVTTHCPPRNSTVGPRLRPALPAPERHRQPRACGWE